MVIVQNIADVLEQQTLKDNYAIYIMAQKKIHSFKTQN